MKLEFSKNSQTSNFMKIQPVGAELFHAADRCLTTKLRVPFCSVANAPKTMKTARNSDQTDQTTDMKQNSRTHVFKSLTPSVEKMMNLNGLK
jgi:hypothetical protein